MYLTHFSLNHPTLFLAPDGDGGGGSDTPPETLLSGQEGDKPPAASQTTDGTKGFMGEDGVFLDGWTGRLPEELGEARTGLGKFKNFGEMARSHVNLEQKLGSKANMVALPGDNATKEEVAAYRKAIGMPEKIEDYKVAPDQLPEGVTFNEELAKPFIDLAFKHGIPPAVMKDMIALDAQREAQRTEAVATLAKQQLTEGHEALRKEWGSAYDSNLQLATKAVHLAGIDVQSPGLTDPLIVKAFAKLAGMLSDDKFVGVGGRNGIGTTEDAKDIMTNPQNPLNLKYRHGDPDTVAHVRRLLAKSSAK